ncbi:MAG: hypothetical protein VX464_03070 [Pseudomonadota bacterium]|nr:hypothetical protein [Pseudomonadota bacterium]
MDADPAHFGRFHNLVRKWQSKRDSEKGGPGRRDFDFFEFRGWWGKVAIARIETDPFDVRFVLWGTRLVDWWGVDYTNKRLGEASITPEAWTMVEGRYFQTMHRDPFIGVVCGYLDQYKRPHLKILGIDLPLFEDGALSHVLSIHMEIGLDDEPPDILEGLSMEEFL